MSRALAKVSRALELVRVGLVRGPFEEAPGRARRNPNQPVEQAYAATQPMRRQSPIAPPSLALAPAPSLALAPSGRAALLAMALATALATAGCQHKPAPGESIAEACRLANNGHEVKASGYLQAPILVGCDHTDCTLQLTPTRGGTYGLSVRLRLGSGPSTMTPLPPPKENALAFSAERVSVSIRDTKGGSVGIRDVVRVTGIVNTYESSGEVRCEVAVAQLESL